MSAGNMVAHVHTVAFRGIEVLGIDVQVQMAAGLPDKAVGESRERVRGARFQISSGFLVSDQSEWQATVKRD